jgi:hypothetical protein
MRYLQLIALSLTFAVSGLAHAQTTKSFLQEYDNTIKGAETVSVIGPDLFGEGKCSRLSCSTCPCREARHGDSGVSRPPSFLKTTRCPF